MDQDKSGLPKTHPTTARQQSARQLHCICGSPSNGCRHRAHAVVRAGSASKDCRLTATGCMDTRHHQGRQQRHGSCADVRWLYNLGLKGPHSSSQLHQARHACVPPTCTQAGHGPCATKQASSMLAAGQAWRACCLSVVMPWAHSRFIWGQRPLLYDEPLVRHLHCSTRHSSILHAS